MENFNGISLRFNVVEERASYYAIAISDIIASTSIYKELYKKLPSPRLLLYFRYIIKKEIYPYVWQASVLEWCGKNSISNVSQKKAIKIPNFGVYKLLLSCWDFSVPLETSWKENFYVKIKFLKRNYKIRNYFHKENVNHRPIFDRSMIACHYAEGIDPRKRNDLNWYYPDHINPKNVLIYFDEQAIPQKGKFLDKNVINQIEEQGFQWVVLKKGVVENQDINVWGAPKLPFSYLIGRKKNQNSIDGWIRITGNFLLKRVHYWEEFYRQFNIKIHYIPEENRRESIAKAIAFDINPMNDGVLMGKQRSEIFLPFSSLRLGYHPNHVFFIWSSRAVDYIAAGCEEINSLVVTGYPYDISMKSNNFSQILRQKGAKFIVSLFDNIYGMPMHFPRHGIIQFYKSFLAWVISDPEVGLIIKSKKSYILDSLLTLLNPLLTHAFETGRCIRVNDEVGRYPSDASFGADMAIGIGLSTAVIEAVIGGCRGIHYDMTYLRNHEFYKWGHEKIIFDNLGAMMKALKKFKENPNSDLGDWSVYKNKLDPYNDNKGGQRMGMYMKWLLEGFEKGNKREEAIRYANALFMNKWGSDKVWYPKNGMM